MTDLGMTQSSVGDIRSEFLSRRSWRSLSLLLLLTIGSGAVIAITPSGDAGAVGSRIGTHPTIAASLAHSLVVKTDGTLWTFGNNAHGELGTGTNVALERNLPTQVMTGVSTVAAGDHHSLALKVDGTLWAFGDNTYGQLGKSDATSSPVPIQVLNGVSEIAAGGNHSMALKTDGTLWTFGDNTYGQLGRSGATALNSVPTQIMSSIAAIATGGQYSMVLKTDGTLWTFGENGYGELGTSQNVGTSAPNPTPTQVMTSVSAIAAGGSHSMVLKADHSLWTFGLNFDGELGTGRNIDSILPNSVPEQVMSGVAAVAAGGFHSMVLRDDGTVWTFGANTEGQLGRPLDLGKPRQTPIQVMSDVSAIAAGGYYSMALRPDGSLWAFGNDFHQQLGIVIQFGLELPTQVMTGVRQPIGLSTDPGTLVPLSVPGRLLDSRTPSGNTIDGQHAAVGRIAARRTYELPISGRAGVPADAASVMLNVTAVDPSASGFITVFPCGQPVPDASNLNYAAHDVIPNAVVSRLGTAGKVCIYTYAETDILVDVAAYFPAK